MTPRLIGQLFLALLLLCLLPLLASAGAGPNAPSGTTRITDYQFSTWNNNSPCCNNLGNGWFNVYPGSDCFVVSDSGAPSSPPGVLRQHRAAGSATGGCAVFNEALGNNGTSYATYPRVYGKMVFKLSNPFWQVASGNHKLTGYIAQQGNNLVFENVGHGGPWTLALGFNGPADNCHLRGNPSFYNPYESECATVYTLFPNTGQGGSVQAGVWNTLEFIFQLGTCPSCRNGMVIWYLNGVRIGDWRNFNHASINGVFKEWDAWRITHTWDGQSQENINVESYIDLDEVWLGTFPAGVLIPAGGEIPPPPDTTPPGAPSNFNVTMNN